MLRAHYQCAVSTNRKQGLKASQEVPYSQSYYSLFELTANGTIKTKIIPSCVATKPGGFLFRLRVAYLKAILEKDVQWFDVRSPGELPTLMEDDVSKVEGAIGIKSVMFILNLSMALFGVVMGLVRGWEGRLTPSCSS